MTKKKESKKYMIVAKCDPYNARFNYNGQKVLRYNGITPVEWIFYDNNGCGYEKKDAIFEIEKIVNDDCNIIFHDESDAKQMAEQLIEDFGEEMSEAEKEGALSISWFVGDGWYAGEIPAYLVGEEAYSDDAMSYSIQEMELYDTSGLLSSYEGFEDFDADVIKNMTAEEKDAVELCLSKKYPEGMTYGEIEYEFCSGRIYRDAGIDYLEIYER